MGKCEPRLDKDSVENVADDADRVIVGIGMLLL